MVDDSLFELTAVGCVSRSLLLARPQRSADTVRSCGETQSGLDTPTQSSAPARPDLEETPTNGPTLVQGGQGLAQEHKDASAVARRTKSSHEPTAQQTDSHHLTHTALRTVPKSGQENRATRNSHSGGAQKTSALAKDQTSKGHRHSSQWSPAEAKVQSACERPSCGPAAPPRRPQASRVCAKCQAENRTKREARPKGKAGRHSGGLMGAILNFFVPGARGPPEASAAPHCRCGSLASAADEPSDAETDKTADKTSLDSGHFRASVDESAAREQRKGAGEPRRAILRQRRLKANGAAESRGEGASSKTGKGLPPSRVRDSIRVTNQRRMRNNSKSLGVQSSRKRQLEQLIAPGDSLAAAQHRAHEEVLLELAASGEKARRQQQQPSGAANSKSVKFGAPDRVMILSPPPPPTPQPGHFGGKLGRGHLHHSQSSPTLSAGQQLRGQRQQLIATNNLMTMPPPAPIIKRAGVPKSSSYSQTEPNKSLEQLFAHYELNKELVDQINEKLKLTETIESNLSALDADGGACGGAHDGDACVYGDLSGSDKEDAFDNNCYNFPQDNNDTNNNHHSSSSSENSNNNSNDYQRDAATDEPGRLEGQGQLESWAEQCQTKPMETANNGNHSDTDSPLLMSNHVHQNGPYLGPRINGKQMDSQQSAPSY